MDGNILFSIAGSKKQHYKVKMLSCGKGAKLRESNEKSSWSNTLNPFNLWRYLHLKWDLILGVGGFRLGCFFLRSTRFTQTNLSLCLFHDRAVWTVVLTAGGVVQGQCTTTFNTEGLPKLCESKNKNLSKSSCILLAVALSSKAKWNSG